MSGTQENRRDQIDRYVKGQMAGEELSIFEQRMRENAQLAHAVHMHKDVLKGIEYYFMQQLKSSLILSDQPKKSRLPSWAIAAIVALAISVIAALFLLAR
jgi:outer membrane scaffolding protein for murein synthesis (MipA/OmpV family)